MGHPWGSSRSSQYTAVLAVGLLLVILVGAGPTTSTSRRPKPTVVEERDARSMVREAFSEDYNARPQSAAEKGLPQKLFDEAMRDTTSPIMKYALLMEAELKAASQGRLDLIRKTIQELGNEFEVDTLQLRMRRVTFFESTDYEKKAFAWETFREAMQANRYEVAQEWLHEMATTLYKRKAEKSHQATVRRWSEICTKYQKTFKEVQAAREKLKTDPTDLKNAELVAQYVWLHEGKWDEGLSLLAKAKPISSWTGTSEYRAAQIDVTNPEAADVQFKLAESLWDCAESKHWDQPVQSYHLRQRAYYWYNKAIPNLAGVELAVAKKRVAAVESGTW